MQQCSLKSFRNEVFGGMVLAACTFCCLSEPEVSSIPDSCRRYQLVYITFHYMTVGVPQLLALFHVKLMSTRHPAFPGLQRLMKAKLVNFACSAL